MKVRAYGRLADLLGSERDVGIKAPCTVRDLRAQLLAECPEAAEGLAGKRVRTCVGDRIVQDGDIIPEGGVLELLAPVSGG